MSLYDQNISLHDQVGLHAESFPYPPNIETIVSTFANPRYGSPSPSVDPIVFDCTIDGQASTFNASASDPTDYGQDIYGRATAGEWGAIAPYTTPAPPSQADLYTYANNVLTYHRGLSRTYNLPPVVTGDIGAISTAEINSYVTWGTANPTGTVNWVDSNNTVVPLTGAQCVTLGHQTQAYRQSLYDVLANASTGIANGTITTYAQIDALPWPV
jgi:hypothetical protein